MRITIILKSNNKQRFIGTIMFSAGEITMIIIVMEESTLINVYLTLKMVKDLLKDGNVDLAVSISVESAFRSPFT